MFPQLARLTGLAILLLRLMAGLVFATSGSTGSEQAMCHHAAEMGSLRIRMNLTGLDFDLFMRIIGIALLCFIPLCALAQDQTPSSAAPPTSPPSQQSPSVDKKKDQETSQAQKTIDATVEATKRVGEATLGKVRDWETSWLAGAYVGRNRELLPLTMEQRRAVYLHQTLVTPGAYMKRMFDAGIDQVRGVPSQWDDGWGGYAERFASREGQFISANSLAALGDAALRYEPRYDQCRCSGFKLRLRHAFARNFYTYNSTESQARPQWALYAGAFGGGVISTAWKPHPRNAFAEGGRAMLGQAGYGVLLNFFTEFATDINRKLGAKK